MYSPCHNAGRFIAGCLEGVRCQAPARPARVLLVDDGSSEPLPPLPGVEVIRHGANLGLGAARNTALEACATPLLAALDADAVPGPGWLQALLDALNEFPEAAGAGGMMEEAYAISPADRWRSIHMAQHWGGKQLVNPRFLFGSNTLFKTVALRRAGGYDAALRTNNEDRTISDKLYALGMKLVYTPAARCRHMRRDTIRTILPGYWKWHHARGLARGDFDSPEGILSRIKDVNFGIFQYRLGLDREAKREELVPIDAAGPWVFCALDLKFFTERTGRTAPCFPAQTLLAWLAPAAAQAVAALCPASALCREEDWHRVYMDIFAECLSEFKWPNDFKVDLTP